MRLSKEEGIAVGIALVIVAVLFGGNMFLSAVTPAEDIASDFVDEDSEEDAEGTFPVEDITDEEAVAQ